MKFKPGLTIDSVYNCCPISFSYPVINVTQPYEATTCTCIIR